MSKQLTLSAALSAMAMVAMVLGAAVALPTGGSAKGATAHGPLFSVLLRT